MRQLLEADSMWLDYGGHKILQSIYIQVARGKVTGLLGRNGTGKSSLLKMIFGTLRGQSQSVRVDRNYVSHPYLEKNLIRYLPQHHFVPSSLRVGTICSLYGVSFGEMMEIFPELGGSQAEKLGHLSGGKIRLIETLLILLSPVDFILLDEPFTHLSPLNVEKLSRVIVQQKEHKGIILSDHIYDQVLNISDDTYVIVPVGRSILLKNPMDDLRSLGYIS
jgi:ABC-type multidrug transport system ATPase subunit